MTKASAKFAQKLATKMKNVERINDMLIISPTRHFVRGFLFDRTPVKNDFYVWGLIVPLYCPSMAGMSLNYSYRIPSVNGPPMMVNINCSDDLIFYICNELEEKHIGNLSLISDPIVFIQQVEPKANTDRVNVKLDFAIAHCLAGDCAAGKALMMQIMASESQSPILPRVQETTKQVLASLEKGPETFLGLIASFEAINLKLHFPGLTRELL
jgi:hypothetical protein